MLIPYHIEWINYSSLSISLRFENIQSSGPRDFPLVSKQDRGFLTSGNVIINEQSNESKEKCCKYNNQLFQMVIPAIIWLKTVCAAHLAPLATQY